MSPIISEEDVLAALLLRWMMVSGALHDVAENDHGTPTAVGWIAWDRCSGGLAEHEAAIADSERRYEVERLTARLLAEVEWYYNDRATSWTGIEIAFEALEAARAEVVRHAGR